MNATSEPSTVTLVDLSRYVGTWYEIVRLPMRHEPEDYTDITATYSTQDDGKVRVDNRARSGDGKAHQSVGEATVEEGSHGSKLKVSFMPEGLKWIPFTKGDYWVLRLDDEYQVSLVGSPDRKYLWLLARSPQLAPTVVQDYLSTARQQGFDLTDLITTPQLGKPVQDDEIQ